MKILKPTRAELEQFLGKSVEVELFDGDIICGFFDKTDNKNNKSNPSLFLKKNCYYVKGNYIVFKSSHINKISMRTINETTQDNTFSNCNKKNEQKPRLEQR